MNSTFVRDQLAIAATGVTRFGLRLDAIRGLQLSAPGLASQRAIADYLDAETARIDALISKKRRMLDLLEERLVALASDLVQGERRSVPTEIPSMPSIPSTWRLLRNKVFMYEVNDPSPSGDEEMLSVSHITGVTPRSEKSVYMFEAESTVGYKRVRPGDLVINTMWAWMGAAGVSRVHGMVSPAYGVYRIDPSVIVPGFYDMLVRTPAYVTEMTRFSRGVTSSRLRLYPDEFLALAAPVPPLSEQRRIVDRFTGFASVARLMTTGLGQQIVLLQEHRQALITVAVTGELDIAGAAA